MERKYFLVLPSGKSAEIVKIISDEHKAAHDQAQKILDECGGSGFYRNSTRVTGIIFEQAPTHGWLKKDGYYSPDRRTASGKKLWRNISSVKFPDSIRFNSLLGADWVIVEGNKFGLASLEHIGGDAIIGIPVSDKGEYFIPPDCKLLKMSEYYALKEKAAPDLS